MKLTMVELHTRDVNPYLTMNFVRGTGVSRAPFHGIDISPGEKMKAVQDGLPDGRSGNAITREGEIG